MRIFYHFGRYILMLLGFFKSPEKPSVYWNQFLIEATEIGVGSLLIVSFISLFIGAVTTVQTAVQMSSGIIPNWVVGSVVNASSILELAPTVTCLVLAGKVGSQIASQLGTMRVTEQIDALEVMGINSSTYLIMPKIIAAVVTFPLLVGIAAFLQNFGGILAGQLTGEITVSDFVQGARDFFDPFFIIYMLIKAATFGFIISSIASYQGFYTRGGALEVGQASTRAVVTSCILILVADFVLAQILL